MIPLESWRGKKVAILGYGRTGKAALASFLAVDAQIWLWDDRFKPGDLSDIENENVHYLPCDDWPQDLAVLCVSPGIICQGEHAHVAVKFCRTYGIQILSDVELVARELQKFPNVSLVAITGTNGKSTTVSMVQHILQSAGCECYMGGNIGVAVMTLPAPASSESPCFYIWELSSYHLENCYDLAPDVAVMLPITKDHIEHHGSMEAYIQAKARIFQSMNQDQTAFIWQQAFALLKPYLSDGDDFTLKLLNRCQKHSDLEGEQKWQLYGSTIYYQGKILLECQEVPALSFAHQQENALTASSVCSLLGVSSDDIRRHLVTFQALPHRSEFVLETQKMTFINDSKATNLQSAILTIQAYDNVFLIAGGIEKTTNYDLLWPLLPRLRHVCFLGDAAPAFIDYVKLHDVPYSIVSNMREAVEKATILAREYIKAVNVSCQIILSPACSSLDMFCNFEDRGHKFCQYVRDQANQYNK